MPVPTNRSHYSLCSGEIRFNAIPTCRSSLQLDWNIGFKVFHRKQVKKEKRSLDSFDLMILLKAALL